MITLITGVPGTGKTCYMMKFLLDARREGRPIFVHGIPELKIEHTPIFCRALSCKVCQDTMPEDSDILYAEDWDKWADTGAFICMDEVQNIYRPRKAGANAPSSVMAFETHRHSGIDFFLLSQSPMLFDSNIRRLIGRHIHLKGNWAGKQQFEWSECQENLKSTGGAVKSSYSLDKKNFALYKSAEIHTKQSRKIPPAAYLLVALLVGGVFLGFRVKNSFADRTMELAPDTTVQVVAGAIASDGSVALVPVPAIYNFEPLIINHPESAPAFAHLVEVVSYPRVAACIYTVKSGRCNCYSQQGTTLDVEYSYCRNYVRERPFDPYKSDLDSAISPKRQNRPLIVSDLK